MLSSISVVDVLENGVEIPLDHNYENHEWGWSINGEDIYLWSVGLEERKYQMGIVFINKYRVFELDEYIIVVLEEPFNGHVGIYAIFPEFA